MPGRERRLFCQRSKIDAAIELRPRTIPGAAKASKQEITPARMQNHDTSINARRSTTPAFGLVTKDGEPPVVADQGRPEAESTFRPRRVMR